MIITFLCPSQPHPIGGNIALYHFANAMARRGHDVRVCHLAVWGSHVTDLAEISWFRFDPRVSHVFAGGTRPSPADVAIGTGGLPEFGMPTLLLQGIDMLHPWLERLAIRTPALRLCVASWLVDVAGFFGVERDQFTVVPCGIDHDTFRVLDPAAERPIDVAVLWHHHEAKGWPVAAAALRRLLAERPGLRVEVFGARDPGDDLPAGVHFHQELDHDALSREVYNRTKVFLQASWWEGFGFTAVEAMACGAALVTTDNGGSRDYAIDGETARVVPRGDHEALAEAVASLLDDPAHRAAIAERGRAHSRTFDWDRSAAIMEAAMLEYLADPDRFLVPPGPDLTVDLAPGDLASACLDGRAPTTTPANPTELA